MLVVAALGCSCNTRGEQRKGAAAWPTLGATMLSNAGQSYQDLPGTEKVYHVR